MRHKFKFWVEIENEDELEIYETKGYTGVEAWTNMINNFGIAFNTGAVLSVRCEVDGKESV